MFDRFREEEFEKLFRKGSEQYDFEYSPEAWKQMEDLLDRRRNKKLLVWWLGLGAAFVLIAALWLAFHFSSMNDKANNADLIPATESAFEDDHFPENTHSKVLSNEVDRTEQTDDGVRKEAFNSTNSVKPGANSGRAGAPGEVSATSESSDRRREGVFSTTPSASRANNKFSISGIAVEKDERFTEDAFMVQELNDIVAGFDEIGEMQPTDPKRMGKSTALTIDPSGKKNQTRVAEPLPTVFKNLRFSEIENSMPHIHLPDGMVQPRLVKHARSASLYFLLHAGASTSKAGIMGYSDWDWRFGFSAIYFPSSRLGFSLGINYIRDSYQAGKADYSPQYGFWTDKVAPDWTDAVCDILELPVGITYHLSGADQSGFFGSAGVSSIIMLSEKYYYNYEDPKPHYVMSWHGSMANKDWFSTAELGFGYQWKLSNRGIIRIAPFAQIPLKGIGHGDVMLSTIGVNMGYGLGIMKAKL